MGKLSIALLVLLLLIPFNFFSQTKLGGSARVGGSSKTTVSAGSPVDFVNDTFTDTAGTVLSSHTGELGATWTQHGSYTTATITIGTSGTVADKDSASGTGMYYASGTGANANYTVECELIDTTSANLSSACVGWVDTGSDSMVGIRRQNSTTVQFFKIIAGTFTSQQTVTVSYSQDQARELKITRSGNDFTAFLDEAALGAAVTISDSEVSGVGRVGIRMTGAWADNVAYPVNYIKAYQ